MRKTIGKVLGLLLLSTTAQADVLKADFTTTYSSQTGFITVPSPASLTLKLNSDGTVAVNLAVSDSTVWRGVGLDSLPQLGFPQSSIVTSTGNAIVTRWGTVFGELDTGIKCSPTCTGSANWIIGSIGQFTSVNQVINGTRSEYDAYFGGANAQYGALFSPVVEMPPSEPSQVPEPANMFFVSAVLLGLTRIRRRVNVGS
jgi:hypothetical protein